MLNTQLETPTTENVILEMLLENTGISFLDSGGNAGRAWQQNQAKGVEALRAEPAAWLKWGQPIISTFHFLNEQLTYAPVLDFSLRGFMQKSENSYLEDIDNWLDFLGVPRGEDQGFYEDSRFSLNTYNDQYCLLSQSLQYVCFTLNKKEYVALQIHGGADIRGGYTAPRVFEADRESLLFDSESVALRCNNCALVLSFRGYEVDEHEPPKENVEAWTKKLNEEIQNLKNWDFHEAGCPNCGAKEWQG
jgi:hypothetical protein